MAIGINDLGWDEDDDLLMEDPTNPEGEGSFEYEKPIVEEIPRDDTIDDEDEDEQKPAKKEDASEEVDLIASLLKAKGIEDPSKISFINDDDEIEEIDWETLTDEEKFNILNSSDVDIDYALEEDELSVVNEIRESGLSANDWLAYKQQEAIANYLDSLEENPQFEVDTFSDDEIFILDMQSRIPDLSDEEAQVALAHAKENEVIFNRQIESLRNEYKELELQKNEQESLLREEEQREVNEQFATTIYETIQNLDSIGGFKLELEEEDMVDISELILGTDKIGMRYLQRALNDPETLVKMAWFATKGDEALESITDYFKKEIKSVRESSYNKGLEDAKKGVTPTKGKAKLVTKQPTNQQNQKQVTSIDDLDDWD